MPREVHNPDTLFNSLQYGFSQIAVATGSKIVAVSGQVGWDKDEEMIGKDDLEAQTVKAFQNLDIALQTVGGNLNDVVSLRIYIVADVMDEMAAIRNSLKQFFGDQPPTATWIGVPRLANKDFLIEVEALAVM
jgi:enamine deaminase RidA (YjgF/YER057c/UK114 family)